MTPAQLCEEEGAKTAAAPFPVPALSSVRICGAGLPSDTLPSPSPHHNVATTALATRRGGLRPKALLSRSPSQASSVRSRGNIFSSADRGPLVPLVSTNSFSTVLPPVLSNTLSFSTFLGEQPGGPPAPPPPSPHEPAPPPSSKEPPPFHFAFPAIVGPQPPPPRDPPALSAGDPSAGEPPLLSAPCLSFNSLAHLGDLLLQPPAPRVPSLSVSFSTLLREPPAGGVLSVDVSKLHEDDFSNVQGLEEMLECVF